MKPHEQGPLVSIITVVRNGRSTLEATIRSVIEQSFGNVEHLVVDGGSTDGTLELLRSHDDRLALWISEPDTGISDAFNKGVALATGDIIGILNADDEYTPDAVERSVAALAAAPWAGFSFGGCELLEDDGTRYYVAGAPHYEREITRWLPGIFHPTVFVRREVYEKLGLFSERHRIAMDYELYLRMHLNGIGSVHVPQLITRMRLGGASSKDALRGHREVLATAVAYGQPVLPAFGAYTTSVVGHFGKRFLQGMGARRVLAKLHQLRYGSGD
jgi:GT2 family glycosyltransferase